MTGQPTEERMRRRTRRKTAGRVLNQRQKSVGRNADEKVVTHSDVQIASGSRFSYRRRRHVQSRPN